MESILLNTNRPGNVSSSNIHKLIKPGTGKNPFSTTGMTYLQELNIERKMGVSLKQEVYSRPMAWGHVMEAWIFQDDKYFDTSYESVGNITLNHPTIKHWVGSPDYKSMAKSIVAECKGYERKKFSLYADAIATKDSEVLKNDCPDEYWQGVSNAIILGVKHFQPVLFMPYLTQLVALKDFVENFDTSDPFKYKWIADIIYSENYAQLPYLPDGGFYKNFNSCIIEIPQEDKDYLTSRVELAGTLLNPFHKIPETI